MQKIKKICVSTSIETTLNSAFCNQLESEFEIICVTTHAHTRYIANDLLSTEFDTKKPPADRFTASVAPKALPIHHIILVR